jgi:uncharacterized protein involved in response to NO
MKSGTTAQRARQWTGPALFSFGFRPFFLAGALYSAIVIADRVAAFRVACP